MQSSWNSRSTLIILIMLSLGAWAIFHAVGAYRLNRDLRRPLVVLACMAAYVGFWGLLLLSRRSRLRRDSSPPDQAP